MIDGYIPVSAYLRIHTHCEAELEVNDAMIPLVQCSPIEIKPDHDAINIPDFFEKFIADNAIEVNKDISPEIFITDFILLRI